MRLIGAGGEDLDNLLGENLPDDVQRAMLGTVFESYREAAKRSRGFDEAQRRKVYGHERLGLMESGLKTLALKFPELLDAKDTPTRNGSGTYLALRAGRLLITAHTVQDRYQLPRLTHYRRTLAQGLQHDLFVDVSAVDGRTFWSVLLLHNCARKLRTDPRTGDQRVLRLVKAPGFALLVIPTRDGLGHLFSRDLFDKYPDTVRTLQGLREETVQGDRRPKPKHQERRADEQAS